MIYAKTGFDVNSPVKGIGLFLAWPQLDNFNIKSRSSGNFHVHYSIV